MEGYIGWMSGRVYGMDVWENIKGGCDAGKTIPDHLGTI